MPTLEGGCFLYFGDDAPRSVADAQNTRKSEYKMRLTCFRKVSVNDTGTGTAFVMHIKTHNMEFRKEFELGHILTLLCSTYLLLTHEFTKIIQFAAWIGDVHEELTVQTAKRSPGFLVDLPKGHREFGYKIKAIRLFLAYASHMGFMVYKMDVKSALLYGQIEEEVYNLGMPLVQDGDAAEVDEHLYRSMIGSLMYLTTSRPDIMFVVCACARFQVSPKISHLLVVKRIFRYLKGKPSLGLWYPKDSPLEFDDTPEKQIVVATSTTEAEYVAAANCCGQVLWIQNQLLDYSELMNLVTKLTERIGVLEDDLRKTKKTYSSAFTKLILRVKKLEFEQSQDGKKKEKKARIVHSDDEDIEDDSSKQGRKLSDSKKGSAEVSTAGATKRRSEEENGLRKKTGKNKMNEATKGKNCKSEEHTETVKLEIRGKAKSYVENAIVY
ncbi:putative ribonuclease H-like domain-containing protein [Tanacetum coccineum]